MDQFTHLPEFRVIICRKCQYAVLPSEIDSHFTKAPVYSLSKTSRRYIVQQVAKVSGLIQNQEELQHGFVFPVPRSLAIPELGKPKTDGLGCLFIAGDGKQCPFVYGHEQQIREHYYTHSGVTPRKRGRPSKKSQTGPKRWQEGVHCQRFFLYRFHSGFFEVQRDPILENSETPEARAKKLIQGRIDVVKEKEKRRIEMTDPAQEPDSWLRKVRWHYYLVGKDPETLRTLIRAVDDSKEALTVIHASFVWVIKVYRNHTTDEVVGEAALCTVNSVEYGKKTQNPFYMDMKANTYCDYQAVWLQILSYIVRCETDWVADDRPGYRLTRYQRQAFDALMTQAAAFHRVEVTDEISSQATKQMTELDWQCLQFCIQLLDHRLYRDVYKNVIISGLSVLGI